MSFMYIVHSDSDDAYFRYTHTEKGEKIKEQKENYTELGSKLFSTVYSSICENEIRSMGYCYVTHFSQYDKNCSKF